MSKVELLQDKFSEIQKLKESGLRNEDIAKLYNTSKSTITRLFQANNIYSRNLMNKELTIPLIVKDYLDGKPMMIIAEKYHTSLETVSNILKENNVKIRNAYKTTYTLDEHYFDVVDTQEKAYIIGFLAADGCICKNNIRLRLQEGDIDILEKIQVYLNSNRPIYYYKMNVGENTVELSITNEHMASQLKKIGIVENKSLILEFPDIITDNLLPSFIRGLWDGDGFIEKKRYRTGCTGTYMILSSVMEKMQRILNMTFHIYKENTKSNATYTIKISNKNDCIKFLNYIYGDATIYLQRKYDLYQSYINNSLVA